MDGFCRLSDESVSIRLPEKEIKKQQRLYTPLLLLSVDRKDTRLHQVGKIRLRMTEFSAERVGHKEDDQR